MVSPKLNLSLLLLLALALAGCAKEDKTRLQQGEPEITHAALVGSISTNVQSLYESPWKEPCDEKYREKLQEIAAALDGRAEAIRNFQSAGSGTSSSYRVVRMGKTYVREKASPPSPKPGWGDEIYSWQDNIEYYEKIKNTPVDKYWVSLNDAVRGMLLDDVGRVVDGFNYDLDQSMQPQVEELKATLDACLANAGCTMPDFKPALVAFLKSQPTFGPFFGNLQRQDDPTKRREQVEKFKRRVDSDIRRYDFRINPAVKQVARGQFELPLDLGPFADVPDQLRRYVEGEWQGSGYKLTLRWKDQRDYPDVFRILLGEQMGQRAYVSYSDKVVQLYPNVRARSIAHEIGHVLGFRDLYYTVWNPDKCHYVVRTKWSSLMGDPEDGVVLDEEWQELAKYYPLGK